MKLVATTTLLLSKLVFSENKYTSLCNDDGMLEIHIPYANGAISDLLKADAGDCPNLRGPGGGADDNHEYSYNSDDQKAILKINIRECNLDKILTDEPTLRQGEYHMATANVTIGVTEDKTERDLIFYNAILGAECGMKTDYTVSFDYSQKIDTHKETECHPDSPEGQCIVAAFEEYDFTFKEYDDSYENEINTASHKANEMIYLQIESSNLPADKVFSVKQCTFVDKVVDENGVESFERYSMFDATTDCKNDYIDLSVGFRESSVQIQHRLFLLTRGDHDSYSLECDIKVCDGNDDGSDCANWQNTCEGGEVVVEEEDKTVCDQDNYDPSVGQVIHTVDSTNNAPIAFFRYKSDNPSLTLTFCVFHSQWGSDSDSYYYGEGYYHDGYYYSSTSWSQGFPDFFFTVYENTEGNTGCDGPILFRWCTADQTEPVLTNEECGDCLPDGDTWRLASLNNSRPLFP